MSKRPSFAFYPGDWLTDAALRRCSLPARALWIEMLCLMHQGSPRGYLRTGDAAYTVAELSRAAGASASVCAKLLGELERNGVFSRDDEGTIFSRRMIRDEAETERWRDSKRVARGANVPEMSRECPDDVPPSDRGHVREMSRRSSSSSSSSLPPTPQSKLRSVVSPPTRSTALPADFTANATHARLAGELALDLPAEIAAFSDFHRAKGSVFRDWNAAFRTWLRNSPKFNRSSRLGGNNGLTVAEQTRRNAAIALERIEARERARAASAGGAGGDSSEGE